MKVVNPDFLVNTQNQLISGVALNWSINWCLINQTIIVGCEFRVNPFELWAIIKIKLELKISSICQYLENQLK